MIINRLQQYEQRTGNNLPLNVLAKVSECIGAVGFTDVFLTNGSNREAMFGAVLLVGGMIVDKATGGLQPYGHENHDLNND